MVKISLKLISALHTEQSFHFGLMFCQKALLEIHRQRSCFAQQSHYAGMFSLDSRLSNNRCCSEKLGAQEVL